MRTPAQIIGDVLGEAVGDLRDVAAGWRWGHRRLTPRTVEHEPVPDSGPAIPADWPRRTPVRLIRRLLHAAAVRPLLAAELQLDVGDRAEVAELTRPLILVANHASHLDTPVLLDALPARQRRRTGVAVTGDYFFDSGWRAAASAVAFNTFAQSVPGSGPSSTPADLLRAGWNVLIFPEGIRAGDGMVGDFGTDAAALAIEHGVDVLPVGIRGTYAAMPRGRAWPGRPFRQHRPRVSVRFGPVLSAAAGEDAAAFTARIQDAVRTLIAEDRTTWWQSRRYGAGDRADEPPAGSWRRIWEQSVTPQAGGRERRPRIWR